MANILDLTVFEEEYLEVKLPDGETINLKKPTQAIAINIMKLSDKFNIDDIESFIGNLNEGVLMILNHNKELRKFDISYIKKNINIQMAQAVFKAYTEFMNEIQTRKNS